MRRPTRTRRLSTAAIVSLLASVAVAGAGIRSMWIQDYWNLGTFRTIRTIALAGGCMRYGCLSGDLLAGVPPPRGHISLFRKRRIDSDIFNFSVRDFISHSVPAYRQITVAIPLWFPLLLLLIAPVRWLIALPANAPAFPVITDAKRA